MEEQRLPPYSQGDLAEKHVVFFSWRDTHNPEGGGAEVYLEKMAAGLVARGARVTIFTAAHSKAPADETTDQIRFVRRGSKLSVYLHGLWCLIRGVFGPHDLIVDVQNGLPFFTRLVSRKPVVVLVHHVHREQWPIVYPGLTGRIGWWIERSLAPRLYRDCQYIAVSAATRTELIQLGVAADRISVVHNGTDPVTPNHEPKTANPTICVVGRLVPHKQVDHAIDIVRNLLEEFPDLQLRIVGDGWDAPRLHHHAAGRRLGSAVTFEGHLSEEDKNRVYAQSWLMLLPSLKEGWGLVVGEAGAHRTPTVAYRSAGGTTESISDHVSGLLVANQKEMQHAAARILRDPALRDALATGAERMAHQFTWQASTDSFASVLCEALHQDYVDEIDPHVA